MHSQWGQRVHSELAKLDIKTLGRVGVLLGGRSGEREISLMSGGGVLEALHSKGVDAHPFDPGLRSPCLLYTSPSPRDGLLSRMPSSA